MLIETCLHQVLEGEMSQGAQALELFRNLVGGFGYQEYSKGELPFGEISHFYFNVFGFGKSLYFVFNLNNLSVG